MPECEGGNLSQIRRTVLGLSLRRIQRFLPERNDRVGERVQCDERVGQQTARVIARNVRLAFPN